MRRAWVPAAIAVVAATAGCGDNGETKRSDAAPVKAVGKETAGSVVQFADCGDWRAGSRAERFVTIQQLRGQLTPQRSTSAASPLPDARAYELIEKSCAPVWAKSLRLYKLYVRMQGFAPLNQ